MRRGPHKGSRGSGDGAAGSAPTQVLPPIITPTRRQRKSLGKSFDHCSGTVAPEALGYSTRNWHQRPCQTSRGFSRNVRPRARTFVGACTITEILPRQSASDRSPGLRKPKGTADRSENSFRTDARMGSLSTQTGIPWDGASTDLWRSFLVSTATPATEGSLWRATSRNSGESLASLLIGNIADRGSRA